MKVEEESWPLDKVGVARILDKGGVGGGDLI